MLTTFSVFATWFGAESCVGTAGAAYADGLVGVTADPFGYAIVLLLVGLLFAVPLWKMKLTTISDYFTIRYSPFVGTLTAIVLIPTSLLWAAAQIRAFGQVLMASSSLDLSVAITVAAVVVILYTSLGGLLADAVTDLVQGVILIAGLMLVTYLVISDQGGIFAAWETIDKTRLTFIPHHITDPWQRFFTMVESWSVPILGSLIAQELISRLLASRTPDIARNGTLLASVMYLTLGLMPLFIGLIGYHVYPGLEDPEQILPLLAQRHFHHIIYVIFAGALVSAILSTVDSALLSAAALVTHNVIFGEQNKYSGKAKLLMDRLGVIILGITAYVLALHASGIYHLVKDASAFGSAGIFLIYITGIYSSYGSAWNAGSAVAFGVVSYVVGTYVMEVSYPYLTSLLFAGIGFVTGGGIQKLFMLARTIYMKRNQGSC